MTTVHVVHGPRPRDSPVESFAPAVTVDEPRHQWFEVLERGKPVEVYFDHDEQIAISCAVLGFAMYMLAVGKDPAVCLPIVTTVAGCWLPSPVQHSSGAADDVDGGEPLLLAEAV